MNKLLSGFIILSVGMLIGYFTRPFVHEQLQVAGIINAESMVDSGSSGENKILYWVAPMDANYRRDKAGQSPMGMDLVPVYEDEGAEDGVVKISPVVQNNLGVRLSTVKRGQLDRQIKTVGYISFDEEKIYHLHTRVEGWVDNLIVKTAGEVIKQGQKLFEIYSPSLVSAQEEYLSALKSKNKMLIKASHNRLLALGVHAGQIQQLNKTRKARQHVSYFAAHDGFIKDLNIRQGMFVKPAMEVLTIGQIDTVWVIAEVFERQSGWVKSNQIVDMTVAAYPGKNWQGVVDYIYPTLDDKTRTLRVRVRFDNYDERLKPNMFSNLTINSSLDEAVLLVKREAIIRSGEMQRVVKALGDGKFQSVAVITGSESGDFIQIIKGLKEGNEIVTSAQFLIDSESSLSASFARMEQPGMKAAAPVETKVWVKGKVLNVMLEMQQLSVQHDPVEVWGWPAMEMDIPVIQSMNLKPFKPGDEFNFLIEKQDGGAIKIIEMNKEGL